MVNCLTIKILSIGDIADNMVILKKFAKNSQIHIINFPRKGVDLITISEKDIEFFDSILISKQVKKIKEIKDDFVKKVSDPNKTVEYWEIIFVKFSQRLHSINRNITFLEKIGNSFALFFERVYIKKIKQKNIEVWGKEEYQKLTS